LEQTATAIDRRSRHPAMLYPPTWTDAMLTWIDRFPLYLFVVASLTLGLSPFFPEPHLWEKLKMLIDGTLVKPIDIFDLLLHAAPWILLIIKSWRMLAQRRAT
jgi:hypothetical protein